MKISLNELKKLVDIKIGDAELFQLIGSRLVEIEGVDDWTNKFKNIFVAKVVECSDIEGTHLHLCQIDAGRGDLVQVVCGAPNVKAGMTVAWIAPGAIVPSTFGTPEPFEIGTRKMRGFESNGMLAAADELALGSDHEGILSLDPKIAKPGMLLSEALDLNDKILDIENKSLTHRPDCFGLIGFAREVAGILGEKFVEPDFLSPKFISSLRLKNADALKIEISDPKICPRYSCAVFDFSKLPQSRESFMASSDLFLIKAGMRPISPIVDLTNYLMLLTGQPLHAFDYDKFVTVGGSDTPRIGVRLARPGEKLTLLDDKEIELTENDILITSSDTPVALAGAMGGKNTEIDSETKKIILESATFSLYNLRKTQMSHGIFSEAITRFTKGQPAGQTLPVLAEAARLLNVEPEILADSNVLSADATSENSITISVEEINSLLGSSYSPELITRTLENTGFTVVLSADETSENSLKISAPFWRTDIHIKEDIIEEVGRLLGYDNLPLNFPLRPFVCAEVEPLFALKSRIRTVLSDRLGANEVLTYSFVSKALEEKVNEDFDDSYKIVNSISPELECFRQSIVPSLLDKIRENEKAGYKDFTLYELNQISKKSFGLNDENVPVMKTDLGLVTFGDFYAAKQILLELEKSLGLEFILKPIEKSAYFEPAHSAAIFLGEEKLGELGEIKSSVLKRFKLSEVVSALELTLEPCAEAKTAKKFGIKLSRFPFVSRDLTFRVDKAESYARIESEIKSVLSSISGLIYILEPASIFRKENDTKKNLSFHLKLANENKTFESAEISAIIEKVTKAVSALGAEVV